MFAYLCCPLSFTLCRETHFLQKDINFFNSFFLHDHVSLNQKKFLRQTDVRAESMWHGLSLYLLAKLSSLLGKGWKSWKDKSIREYRELVRWVSAYMYFDECLFSQSSFRESCLMTCSDFPGNSNLA